ncbi:LytTR family DNA-binding domain-containing protein [Chitinophaga sp. Cy-1792]|uniref:LytR/AlgR family response regulator transcription factor n=1 Tax=Chitinophaga sp. Cy-1792 TaxID=2608339 RepID=UPI00141E16EF|nr:LytTR family DNA-binding domain-containing protein [Chitinophaga sp. Cy-1792]NIG56403.1 response regulator transcription factor [Chitinophaga sp. Cy-1792]
MKVLIIEDEAKAARELASILQELDGEITVLATTDSIEQSVAWLQGNPAPDLIFSDIQLADGLCFDIFRQQEVQSPVIFCTAFDEYLMNAFDTNALSYLLKPITREKVSKALQKYQDMKAVFQSPVAQEQLQNLMGQLKVSYKSALLVYEKDKIIPVQVKDIACFYLDKSQVHLTTFQHHHYLLSSSLDELEKMIDPALFFRANRQFLINRHAIANAARFFARKLVLQLTVETAETVVVSKARAAQLLQWMEAS